MSLKYLIDENVNPAYSRQLRRKAADLVVRVIGEPDTPSKGTLDPEILIWCEVANFILVTNNGKQYKQSRYNNSLLPSQKQKYFKDN